MAPEPHPSFVPSAVKNCPQGRTLAFLASKGPPQSKVTYLGPQGLCFMEKRALLNPSGAVDNAVLVGRLLQTLFVHMICPPPGKPLYMFFLHF